MNNRRNGARTPFLHCKTAELISLILAVVRIIPGQNVNGRRTSICQRLHDCQDDGAGQSAIGERPARGVVDVHKINVMESFPAHAAAVRIADAVARSKKSGKVINQQNFPKSYRKTLGITLVCS